MYDSHDEVYYVVRRADGTPLAVPAWMTRPEAAHAKIVSTARLPVRVLLELRRVTSDLPLLACAQCARGGSRCRSPEQDANDNCSRNRRRFPTVRLPLEVQEQLRQALVQWMQALAKMIREEDGDEQDHR